MLRLPRRRTVEPGSNAAEVHISHKKALYSWSKVVPLGLIDYENFVSSVAIFGSRTRFLP
jgi:hypothetical protein